MRKDIVFQVAQRFVSAPKAGFALPLTANVRKKDGAIFAIALDGKCVQILWQMVFAPVQSQRYGGAFCRAGF